MYEIQQHYPFNVTPSPDGSNVTLHIQMDPEHVGIFVHMISSLSDFFTVLNNKVRAATTYHRIPAILEQGRQRVESMNADIVATYRRIRTEQPTLPIRSAISETNRTLKPNIPNITYDIVKQVLVKSGELKKDGFFKKNA